MTSIALIGGGGHSLVVADAAREAGWTVTGVCDDAEFPAAYQFGGLKRMGALKAAIQGMRIVCLGLIASRRKLIDACLSVEDEDWATVVHPRAVISTRARVDRGGFVGALAVVQPSAVVGPHGVINTGAIVEHECELGENVHVAPGAVLAGLVRIGSDTLVGVGARILPGIRIGSGCTIGAGAVVVRDVPDGAVVIGVPARVQISAR